MRKIIWAIAVVFSVQVAFQLAMSADRSNSEYAALRTPLQNGIDMPSPAPDAHYIDTNIAPIQPSPDATTRAAETRVLIRYVDVPASRRQASPASSTTAFKPVVIIYDRTGALTDGAGTTAEHQRTEKSRPQPEDNRSFIAKVVTKPYDWVKAVGSKLH
jgi:hypothetical protein